MRRGTTPTLTFTLPIDASKISCLFVTFCQRGKIILEKNIDDCELDKEILKVTLSQKETLSFEVGRIDIQIKLKTEDGSVMASDIEIANVEKCLKDCEI